MHNNCLMSLKSKLYLINIFKIQILSVITDKIVEISDFISCNLQNLKKLTESGVNYAQFISVSFKDLYFYIVNPTYSWN